MILFTMLFTIGSEYFIFVNNANNVATQALLSRSNTLATRLQEGISIATALSSQNYLEFDFNNTGGVAVNVTSLFVLSSSGSILACDGVGMPSGQGCTNGAPALPMIANPGVGAPASGYAVTGYQYPTSSSPVVTLKLVTSSGNIFSATYPPSSVSLASQALSSGAIGDLYLSFDSYTYYTVTTHGSNSTCPSASGEDSGFCFQTWKGQTGPAFAISGEDYHSDYLGYSVTLTNLNQGHADIVLDQWSLLYASVPSGPNGKVPLVSWNIVTTGPKANNQIPIDNTYSPVVLHYDQPVTVYFAVSNCVKAGSGPDDGCSTISSYGSSLGNDFVQCLCSSYPAASTIFILSNGWKLAPGSYSISSLQYSEINYGQNTPFVSTLYY